MRARAKDDGSAEQMGAPQGLSKSKARCVMVVQGGPEYTDGRTTVGCAKDEWSARTTVSSVVVVREGHSGRGAGRHTGVLLGIERTMLSREEGWGSEMSGVCGWAKEQRTRATLGSTQRLTRLVTLSTLLHGSSRPGYTFGMSHSHPSSRTHICPPAVPPLFNFRS